jgi:hypothetical protein
MHRSVEDPPHPDVLIVLVRPCGLILDWGEARTLVVLAYLVGCSDGDEDASGAVKACVSTCGNASRAVKACACTRRCCNYHGWKKSASIDVGNGWKSASTVVCDIGVAAECNGETSHNDRARCGHQHLHSQE